MTTRRFDRLAALGALVAGLPAWGQDGIVAPRMDWLWPQIQARITVQTAALSPLSTYSLLRGDATPRALQAGALFGDYLFDPHPFGRFRASGGLLIGHLGGTPMQGMRAGDRLGVALLDGGATAMPGETNTVPYLGLGYSSPLLWSGLSLTADLGVVAGRPSALSGFGRALLGNQDMDAALREMRLAPVLQFGLRYEF
jgi:hypothetical protein